MKRILLLVYIMLISSCFSAVYAAFPVAEEHSNVQTVTSETLHKDFVTTANAPVAPSPPDGAGSGVGLVLGILALVFGILSVATWGAVAAIIFGAAAVVAGIIGLNYPWKLFSLAGLVLGIIGAVVGLVSIAA